MFILKQVPIILTINSIESLCNLVVIGFDDFEPLTKQLKFFIDHKELLFPKSIVDLFFLSPDNFP